MITSIGIIGSPFSGKTTIFEAMLATAGITSSDKIALRGQRTHLAVIKVPDQRLEVLSRMFKPKKTTFANLTFMDFPGSELRGGGNSAKKIELIAELRKMQALILVIKCFAEFKAESAQREIEEIGTELILSDLSVVENRLERLKKDLRAGKKNQEELNLILSCKENLENSIPLRNLDFSSPEEKILRGFQFLSLKPVVIVLNIAEANLNNGDCLVKELEKNYKGKGLNITTVCARLEKEVTTLPPPEIKEFREALKIEESALDKVIRNSYTILNLSSFFTVGDDEVKAWTIKRGIRALSAAGEIHSDLERGFIRAEVISYNDLIKCGSLTEGKKRGLLRLEGKEYLVNDGDIVHFRFNI